MPNDTRSTAWSGKGDGLSEARAVTTVVTGETVDNAKDHDVLSGCRFCGSTKWTKTEPAQIQDDPKAPSDEWLRRRNKRR